MRKRIKRLKIRCTELRFKFLKRMIQSKFMNYPCYIYLKRGGMDKSEISLYLTSIELGLNRAISNIMTDRKNI